MSHEQEPKVSGIRHITINEAIDTMFENTASYGDIGRWLGVAAQKGATHVIVACDTFDYTDYLVYVMPDEDVRMKEEKLQKREMTTIMEVYWLGEDIEKQLNKDRSWTYGSEDL